MLSTIGAATTTNQVNSFISGCDLQNQNNSKELACQIGEDAAKEGMNCDVYELNFANHTPMWIVTLYPDALNLKGYSARYFWLGPQKKEVLSFTSGSMYYQDFGANNTGCRIKDVCSYKMVKSYFGENETLIEENTTQDVAGNSTVEEVTDEACEPVNETTNETLEPTESTHSEINISMKNGTSGDSIDFTSKVSEPTEQKKGWFLEICSDAWNYVFGGN